MTTAREILAQLVAIPVLGGESNDAIISFIRDYLTRHGVASVLVPDPDGQAKACLHARIGPPVDGGVVLSGHTDVVPVVGQQWTSDPFTLVERDGKLYGRGSCDMKGYLACMLAAVPMFLSAKLKTPIYLAFSYDEEIGCLSGDLMAASILNYYTERPKFCIVGEPSMLQPVLGHKGILVDKVIVRGSAGHSSRILTEVSAVHEAARLVIWLEEYMKTLVANNKLDNRFDPPHTSLHVGQIHGGTAHNIIADEAWFTVDIRNIPSDSALDIRADFATYVKSRQAILRERFAGTSIQIEPFHPMVPALDTHRDSDVAKFISTITGRTDFTAVSYAAEAGQFSNAGLATVICGPGDIAQAHRADEFISIEQLDAGVEMMERLAGMLR